MVLTAFARLLVFPQKRRAVECIITLESMPLTTTVGACVPLPSIVRPIRVAVLTFGVYTSTRPNPPTLRSDVLCPWMPL